MGATVTSKRGQLEAAIGLAAQEVKTAEGRLAMARQNLIDYDSETERRAVEPAAMKAREEAAHARHADHGA